LFLAFLFRNFALARLSSAREEWSSLVVARMSKRYLSESDMDRTMSFRSNIDVIRTRVVATPSSSSIFLDKRPASRAFSNTFATSAAPPPVQLMMTTRRTSPFVYPANEKASSRNSNDNWPTWNSTQFSMSKPRIATMPPASTNAFHIGGSMALGSAGVSTAASTPKPVPWTTQTGAPPGGWCVAGSMAEGW
jgi:hypothetical protein